MNRGTEKSIKIGEELLECAYDVYRPKKFRVLSVDSKQTTMTISPPLKTELDSERAGTDWEGGS